MFNKVTTSLNTSQIYLIDLNPSPEIYQYPEDGDDTVRFQKKFLLAYDSQDQQQEYQN